MPSRIKSCSFILGALILAGVVCIVVWIVGMLFLGIPQAANLIGPAAPGLDAPDQAFLATYLLINQQALNAPAGDPDIELALEITEGQTAQEVIDQLSSAGIISNPTLLRYYMQYRGFDTGIEAGQYYLSGAMSPRQIAEGLQSAGANQVAITVIEGWRLEEIAQAIDQAGLPFSGQDFIDAANSLPVGYSFIAELPAEASLEGFLFPDTYYLEVDSRAIDLVINMLDNFEQRVDSDLRAGLREQGLTLYEGVILASIVEREAVIPEERPLIASVYLNRLAQNMKLDADPTVQYALGLQPDGRWWKQGLTLADLELDSPYNTYRYPGLPPTPIANPGLASLMAVAFPESSSFLYFRTTCDGSGAHVFSQTYEEHLQNACP
jgi:UPF0755 protein